MKNNRCIIPEIFIHASPRYVEFFRLSALSSNFIHASPRYVEFFRLLALSSNFKLLNPDDSSNVSEKLAIGSNNVPHNFIPHPHILS